MVTAGLRWAGRLLRSVVLTGCDAAQWALSQCEDRGKALALKLGFRVEWLDTAGKQVVQQQARRVGDVLRGFQPLSLIRQVAGLAIARRLVTGYGRAGWWLIATLVVTAMATPAAQHIADRTAAAVGVTNRSDEPGEPAALPPAPAPVAKPDASRPKPRPGSARNRLR